MKRNRYQLLLCVLFFYQSICEAQTSLYRTYSPVTNTISNFFDVLSETPVLCQDSGYVLSTKLYQMGFETPGGLANYYSIKTDANFVPQWKKPAHKAIALPTGGILLIGPNTIEKVTSSGVQVWYKTVGNNVLLCDGVCDGANIRLVGNMTTYSYVPFTSSAVYINDAFTMLIDTAGNYISHQLFYSSVQNVFAPTTFIYRGSANFTKIKKDLAGNFYLYSDGISNNGIGSNMTVAKFTNTFSFVWGKTWGTTSDRTSIKDIDILPSGKIFATGYTAGNSTNNYTNYAALIKLDALGNVEQHSFFQDKYKISEIYKKSNSNYVISTTRQDSMFMFETDTMMNILWHKYRGKAISAAGSVMKNNTLYTALFAANKPVLISNDLFGNSCASYSIPFSKPSTTISLINFTLSPVSSTVNLVTGTVNNISSQNYIDSCYCPVFIPNFQSNLCVGNSTTLTVLGTGNLSWYGSATGSDFLHSGSQHVFSSSIPTTITVFAQDSACSNNPNRTAVNVVIHSVPSLSFSPTNPTICLGSQVFVSALGATNYTWSNNLPNSGVQNLNPLITTNYTVTGSVAPGCDDTKTMAVVVVPTPTLTVVGPSSICVGSIATFSGSGTSSISWPGGWQGSVFTLSPTYPYTGNFNVVGSNGYCNVYKQVTLTAMALPNLSVVSNPLQICSGQTTTITALGANSYSWSTGASSSSIISSFLTNTVITLYGVSNSCSASTVHSVNVQSLPQLSLSASQTLACMGVPISYSVSGASSYTWNNSIAGNSYTNSPSAGLNKILVSGTGTGSCVARDSLTVYVIALPSLTITGPPSICQGATANFSVAGANSYTWSTTTYSSTGSNAALSPASTSSYAVTGSDGLCSNTATTLLTVNPNPTVAIVSNTNVLCVGKSATLTGNGALTYTWTTVTGILTGPSISVSPSVTSNYTVVGINGFNCAAANIILINVIPSPTVYISLNTPLVCKGALSTLTATGANSYVWDSAANNATTSVIFVYPMFNTSYSVTGTSSLTGCSSTKSMLQAVHIPSFVASSPVSGCSGQVLNLTASGANSYTWNGIHTGSSFTVAPPTNSFYVVSATSNSMGILCTSTNTVNVILLPSPTISVVADRTLVCKGESVQLFANGGFSYNWNNFQAGPVLSASPTTLSTYYVTGSGQNGCLATATISINVSDCSTVLEQSLESEQLIVYPNPNQGSFKISKQIPARYYLFNSLGKCILNIDLNLQNDYSVNLIGASPGIYFLTDNEKAPHQGKKIVVFE